ncbi:hypothetical protein RGUI_3057 [Rhodovulum sp. P5]|uniref:ExbD/TolR family protein n=1 Tax=Rhodovulum sp. P5 TaxID=1564506 RepID=UPI0009C1FE41|nr:hypothetical protein [Rhodovulum sp. P5]ARE41198.1 hypothetical protein RGUI_3057 [Rhodovulum sp. P5]
MTMRRLIPKTNVGMRTDVSLTIVNIVLLLIFFFLVTGQLANAPGIAVELSETAELPIENLPKPILIWGSENEISLNGDPIEPEALGIALADASILHLLIDRNESAQILLELLAKPEFSHLELRLVTIHRNTPP